MHTRSSRHHQFSHSKKDWERSWKKRRAGSDAQTHVQQEYLNRNYELPLYWDTFTRVAVLSSKEERVCIGTVVRARSWQH